MKVSELAKRYDVNADTVRHYVRSGLLLPNIDPNNGYKLFNQTQQKKLGFILKAKSLGFSLQDIKTILEQAQAGQSPCPNVREIMAERLKETEKKLIEMQNTYLAMQNAVKQWQSQQDCTPTGDHICHLIEGFSEEGCCNE